MVLSHFPNTLEASYILKETDNLAATGNKFCMG